MDYEKNLTYFIGLFDALFYNSYIKQRKINRAKIRPYFLSFYRRWYYSAMIDDTLLSPANFVSELNKINKKPPFFQPIIHPIYDGDKINEAIYCQQYSVESHPVVEDLKVFIEYCMPDVEVDEDCFVKQEDKLLIAERVSLYDPFYVEYLNHLAVYFDIIKLAPSIHSHKARVTGEYEKLYEKTPSDVFLSIYEATAAISAMYINQVLPLDKTLVNKNFILDLLRNPMTTDELFEKIYASIGINLSDFFEQGGQINTDYDFENFDEFYHMVMSSTFFLGIIIDKYFHTCFGFYLKVITPEFLIPCDFDADFKFCLEVIGEKGDIDTSLFSPCTCFHLTELGKIITGSDDSEICADMIPRPFSGKLNYKRALKMIRIMYGDEESNAEEIKSIVSDIFSIPDIAHCYEIKVRFLSDKKYWKTMEILPTNSLYVLYTEICHAFHIKGAIGYCFYMNGEEDVFSRYSPSSSKTTSRKTTKTTLDELNLPDNHKILLVINNATVPYLSEEKSEAVKNIKLEIEILSKKKYNPKKLYPNIIRVGQAFQTLKL